MNKVNWTRRHPPPFLPSPPHTKKHTWAYQGVKSEPDRWLAWQKLLRRERRDVWGKKETPVYAGDGDVSDMLCVNRYHGGAGGEEEEEEEERKGEEREGVEQANMMLEYIFNTHSFLSITC